MSTTPEDIVREHSDVWGTEAQFFQFLRGGLRRGLWEKHPVKLKFILDQRVRVPLGKKTKKNPEGIVWGAKCCECEELFRQSECDVDHKFGGYSIKSLDEAREFLENIIFITYDDLQIICKDCHKAKSYAERHGLSVEEAKEEKLVISICQDKNLKNILIKDFNFTETQCSNPEKRRGLVRELVASGEMK